MSSQQSKVATARYPVQVGPNRRHLVDQDGTPLLIQGDAAWSIIAAVKREGVTTYLDDCADKGFNAILVNLLEAYFAPDPPRNLYGEAPFTAPGDFSTPNEAYFEHADLVIGEAARRNILIFLCPTYLGHRSPHAYGAQYGYGIPEGWYDEVIANGVDGCREFGRFLGRRYGRFDNIVWMLGGDRDPGDTLPHMRAMAEGIQEADVRHVFSAHVQPEATSRVEYADETWLSIDFTYSYQILHWALLRDYLRTPVRPNIMIESTYEFDHNASDLQIRRQAYWPLLCGATGQFMGALGLFDFASGWEQLLESSGRKAQAHLGSLIRGRRWWELVPDLSRAKDYASWHDDSLRPLISSGVGELRGLDFASAARTPDGLFAMAYLPTPRQITFDLTQMSGPLIEATWFDPITGAVRPAGLWGVDRQAPFTSPTAQDWVLILESTSVEGNGR
jgi:Protein of unknown function (DUF4038)/Putative collagen-binding domain of a collagenase